MQADLLGLLTQLGVLPPLDLARTVVLARVQWTGALLADERSPAPHRAPPCTGRCSSGAPYAPPGTGTDNRSGQRFPASFHLSKCACKGASCPWCQRGEGRRMQIDGHRDRVKTKPEQSHHLD